MRWEWLRRNEENGESPPQIAKRDGYDVRTVRKQIELAKQEREAREARSLVLRNALERHYEDLLNYAERLNSRISGVGNVSVLPDDDLIEAALRQHLPRSPIWGYVSKWQNLQQATFEQQKKLETVIKETVSSNPKIVALTKAGLGGVIDGVVAVLAKESEQWSHGNTEYSLKDSVVMEPAGEELVNPRLGAYHMGIMDKEPAERNMEIVVEVFGELEPVLKESEEYSDLEKTITEIGRLGRKLREELAVIRLRRIVPGRCRYCPL